MRPIATDEVAADLLVCLSVTTVSPTKTAEPIEMPFGMWTRVGPRNYAPTWGSRPPREEALLRGMTSEFPRMLSTSVQTGRPQK